MTSTAIRAADPMFAAALDGARSVATHGWIAEECDSAALERVARRRPGSTAAAYLAGRAAAIDELRRLTRRRSTVHLLFVGLGDHDDAVVEPGYATVDDLDELARLRLHRLTTREAEVVRCVCCGLNGRQTARALGLDPSRVTQLMRTASRKLA